jgi:hypothetical protein
MSVGVAVSRGYPGQPDVGPHGDGHCGAQALSKQVDFKITTNYELGMHYTGFEFAYCCVLPPYNSILAQVIKPAQGDPSCAQEEHGCNNYLDGYPRLLEGDPNAGLDGLNRETVVRDWDHTTSQFKKYQLRY